MSDETLTLQIGEAARPAEQRQDVRRVLRELIRNKAALLGLAILVLVTGSAVLASVISPADPL
ncbi:MAG: hypothetical protein H6Q86_3570, partial [candidate division NC10 bacterium]|nr:hypothetical protein [candidate division NC10 bacterium]